MWNQEKINGQLWKLSLATVTLALVTGCGNSSSGDSEDNADREPGTSSLSDEEAAAVAVAAVIEYENYGEGGPIPMGDSGGTDDVSTNVVTPLSADSDNVGLPDICEEGSTTREQDSTGRILSVVYDECTFSPEEGAEVYLNGRADFERMVGSDLPDFEYRSEGVYQDWEVRVSYFSADHDDEMVYEAGFLMDGRTATHFTNPTTDPSLQILDFHTESHASCDGDDYELSATFDMEVLATPRDAGVAVEAKGSVDHGREVVEVQTSEEIFSVWGERPREGVLNVTHGDKKTSIEFVEGGLYINNVFHTWDEFQPYLSERENPVYAACLD